MQKKNLNKGVTYLMIKRVEFINKKEFVDRILDKSIETFVMYIALLETISIYPILKVHIFFLLINKTIIKVLFKYLNYANIF